MNRRGTVEKKKVLNFNPKAKTLLSKSMEQIDMERRNKFNSLFDSMKKNIDQLRGRKK